MKGKNSKWPAAIIIVYSIFAIGLIVIVLFTKSNNVQLVSDNYYEKTLIFENQIQASKNVKALSEEPDINIVKNTKQIILTLPLVFNPDQIRGEILLFRPSDAHQDDKIKMSFNSDNKQIISYNNMAAGKWKVMLNWTDGTKDYFFEKVIII